MITVVSSNIIDPSSDTVDFTINCGAEYDCINSTINCPSDAACHVICNGWDSCSSIANINYIISNQHSFTVNCIGTRKCMNKQIRCPSNSECEINCDGGTWACRGITIIGPNEYPLDLYCTDIHEGCELSTIYAQNTSSLHVECGNPTTGCCSCRAITWYVPPKINNNPVAVFIVDNNFYGYDGDMTSQYPMNIYAINGFQDLLFINYTGTNYGAGYDMHCDPNYSTVCAGSRTSWSCDSNGDTTCDAPINADTTTSEPTQFPTESTLNPTYLPTKDTVSPSESPILYTLSPSQSPTENTLSPTLAPTTCDENSKWKQELEEEVVKLNSEIEELRKQVTTTNDRLRRFALGLQQMIQAIKELSQNP